MTDLQSSALVSDETDIFTSIKKTEGVWHKLNLIPLAVFGLYFYGGAILSFLLIVSVLTRANDLDPLSLALLVFLVVPPLIAGFGFIFRRRWIIGVLTVHQIIAVLAVVAMWTLGLHYLITGTVLNNLIIITALIFALYNRNKLIGSSSLSLYVFVYGLCLFLSTSIQLFTRLSSSL